MIAREKIEAIAEELKRRVLLAKGIKTVQEAALEMGIAPVTLRNWLKGKSTLRLETLSEVERWVTAREQQGDSHANVAD